MKRQKKKPNRSKQKQPNQPAVSSPETGNADPAPVSRRAALGKLRNWGIGLTVAAGGGAYMVRDVQATMREQDLSRIGNGIPAIVQVHDPNCPSCAALQRNARDAVCEVGEDKLEFLVANIHTQSGRRFAAEHNVPHITLVFLDGTGKRQSVLSGVHESDQLSPLFQQHFEIHGSVKAPSKEG